MKVFDAFGFVLYIVDVYTPLWLNIFLSTCIGMTIYGLVTSKQFRHDCWNTIKYFLLIIISVIFILLTIMLFHRMHWV